MLLISCFLCIFFAVIIYFVDGKKVINAKILLLLLWGVVLFINYVNPYSWYPLVLQTEILVFISTLGMCVTFLCTKSIRRKVEAFKIDKTRLVFFFSIQFVLLLFLIPLFLKTLTFFINNNYDFALLRSYYVHNSGNDDVPFLSTAQRLFYVYYFIFPCCNACVFINLLLSASKKMWKFPLILSLVFISLITFITAARGNLLVLIIGFVVAFSCFPEHLTNRVKIAVFVICLLSILLSITITSSRSVGGSFLETTVTYFCGGIRLLNESLKSKATFGLDEYTFGVCTFAGPLAFISDFDRYFVGVLGFHFLPSNFSPYFISQGQYFAEATYIGQHTLINAFPTYLYYFYRDGGVVWMLLMVCFLSYLVITVRNKFYKSSNLAYAYLFCALLYWMVMSVCWWEGIRLESFVSIVWGVLLSRMLIKKKRV